MALVRDGRYRAVVAGICRTLGHRFDGDRCSTCHIREDGATSPFSPRTTASGEGGVPVGQMEPVMTTDRDATDRCRNGHAGSWGRDGRRDHRICLACRDDGLRSRP